MFVIPNASSPPSFSEFRSTAKNQKKEKGIMSENKYYIEVDNQFIEVSRKFYTEHKRTERRERYLEERDLAHGKVLYSQLDTDNTTGESAVPDTSLDSLENAVVMAMMVDKLRECLPKLLPEEQHLIHCLFSEGMSERSFASENGLHYMTVHSRKVKILNKLKTMMKN
jgi:DNA-directed RNA polymerase specialized sigma24 family protein